MYCSTQSVVSLQQLQSAFYVMEPKRWMQALEQWSRAFYDLFFPPLCVVCGAPLRRGERVLCVQCLLKMPRTRLEAKEGNLMERMFWGRMPIVRASSLFYYRKGSPYRNLLWHLKYEGQREVGYVLGRIAAHELLSTGFFQGVDALVPVPLHPRKKWQRGYNQSECIARGLSCVTGIPVETHWLARASDKGSQTRQSVYTRWENAEGAFYLATTEGLRGKHLMLVDDVLTTGATLTACADAFRDIDGVRFSIFTLAKAAE